MRENLDRDSLKTVLSNYFNQTAKAMDRLRFEDLTIADFSFIVRSRYRKSGHCRLKQLNKSPWN